MARHEAVSKARWLAAQKRAAAYWHGKEVLEAKLALMQGRYAPIIERFAGDVSEDSNILEVGCGPICLSRLIVKGHRTFVDPLLDDFRRAYPGELPKGEHLAVMAENIPKADDTYDLILSFHTLNHVMNPELVLHEIARLLKPDGTLLLGLMTHPHLLARLRYAIERFFPLLRDDRQPYFYTYAGIKKTLLRHFSIVEEEELRQSTGRFSSWKCEDWLFVCRKKTAV